KRRGRFYRNNDRGIRINAKVIESFFMHKNCIKDTHFKNHATGNAAFSLKLTHFDPEKRKKQGHRRINARNFTK
ncbi:hypothetical protein LJC57_06505, partial [Parabacteroides sp. OttesenSCG-928-G07]|nr:hypothetical protein [Parabacteroides sp. OttesenSCG-928-G07]